MKMKKRITAGLLVLVMIFSLFMGNGWTRVEAESVEAEATLPVSGTSNQVTWSINENGHLEISGTGDWDRRGNLNYTPWNDYTALITSATVTLSGATDLEFMFSDCSGLTSLDLSGFDTSNVTIMDSMFLDCSGLTSLNLSGIDTSNVMTMHAMFYGCSGLTNLDLSGFDTSNVTIVDSMFSGCSGLTSLDLSGCDTSNVTSMGGMFSDCSGLTSLDLSSFDTSNVTSMANMFLNCSGLTSLNLSGFDTSNVTTMFGMFSSCSGLTSLDLNSFDTSKVTSMESMFFNCRKLTSLDLSGFDTSNVTTMHMMFSDCRGLTSLDLSGFDTSNVTTMYDMFLGCNELTSIHTPLHVKTSIELPEIAGIWKDDEKKAYETLPLNLDTSIVLRRYTYAEIVAEAKTVVEEALAGIKGDNDITKDSIQSIIDKALTNAGITNVTATVDSFEKTEATSSSEGSITGSVILRAVYKSDTVAIEKTIEKLSKTDEEEPTGPSEDNKYDDNKTDKGDITTAEGEKLNETAPDSEIMDLSDEAKEAILAGLTKEEKEKYKSGEGLYLYLQVEDVSHKVSKKDKEKIDSVKGDLTVGMYIDITLLLKIGNMMGRPLPNPGGNVEVSIDLPPNLKNTDLSVNREFAIIHIHDGKPEVISARYDAKTNKLIFKTSGFSTFAIVYKDVPATNGAESGKDMENTVGNTVKSGESMDNTASGTPKTGDETNVLWYVLLAFTGGMGAICTARRMRNRKCSKRN